MVRAILFDLDDTLFDRTAALKRWAVAQVGDLDAETFAWVIELDQRGRRPRLHFAAGMIERFGIQRTVAELAAAFPTELAARVEPEPGVRPAIERLAIQARIAIVTNGGAAQRDKLARAGLAHVIRDVFVSSELGVRDVGWLVGFPVGVPDAGCAGAGVAGLGVLPDWGDAG